MMNKQKSPSLSLTKYVLVIPLVTVLVITNHAEALAKKVEKLAPVSKVIQAVSQQAELKDRPGSLSLAKQEQSQEVTQASIKKEAQNTEMQKKNVANENPDDEPFIVVEQMPQFPGGQNEMFKFLAQNVRYPVEAQQKNISGLVIVQFIVSKTGVISNIKVIRGIDPSCDNEAIRVVKAMPEWIPGKQKGINVNVKYTLPVRFALNGEKKEDIPNGGINVIGYGPSKETNPQPQRMAITTNVGKPSLIEINGKEVNESNKPLIIINKKEVSYADFTKIDGRKVKFVGNRESCEKKYLNKLTAKFGDKIDDNTVIVITK